MTCIYIRSQIILDLCHDMGFQVVYYKLFGQPLTWYENISGLWIEKRAKRSWAQFSLSKDLIYSHITSEVDRITYIYYPPTSPPLNNNYPFFMIYGISNIRPYIHETNRWYYVVYPCKTSAHSNCSKYEFAEWYSGITNNPSFKLRDLIWINLQYKFFHSQASKLTSWWICECTPF